MEGRGHRRAPFFASSRSRSYGQFGVTGSARAALRKQKGGNIGVGRVGRADAGTRK